MMNLRVSHQLRIGARRIARRVQSTTTAATSVSKPASSTSTTSSTSVPVAQSLLAALCGVATVSTAAAVVEHWAPVPAFDPQSQRLDQSTFQGRFARMLLACDPKLLFYTAPQVEQAQKLLGEAEQYDSSMDHALWEARRIVEAAIHPDTGEAIPRPFRMSGFVPFNGPICVAMVASPSTSALLFWSWVNQSQNALVNYFNRNASSPMSNETLIKSYSAAVGSALLVAFGLATAIQKRYEPTKAKALLRWVSFPSAIVASSLNCYIVRSPEIDSGIPLQNEHGQVVLEGETSSIAAKHGVNATTLSRAILQAPVYFLPPLLMASVPPLKKLVQHRPQYTVPLTTYLLLTSFGLGLPATVAIFPQMAAIEPSQLEERFQHLRDPETNQPYKLLYYNKGL